MNAHKIIWPPLKNIDFHRGFGFRRGLDFRRSTGISFSYSFETEFEILTGQ